MHKGLHNIHNCLHLSANGQAFYTSSIIYENCSCTCVLVEIIIGNIMRSQASFVLFRFPLSLLNQGWNYGWVSMLLGHANHSLWFGFSGCWRQWQKLMSSSESLERVGEMQWGDGCHHLHFLLHLLLVLCGDFFSIDIGKVVNRISLAPIITHILVILNGLKHTYAQTCTHTHTHKSVQMQTPTQSLTQAPMHTCTHIQKHMVICLSFL